MDFQWQQMEARLWDRSCQPVMREGLEVSVLDNLHHGLRLDPDTARGPFHRT